MYEQFFGLNERPFDLTPNPRYLFLTPSHREALSNSSTGSRRGTGVTVLDRRSRHRQDDAHPGDARVDREGRTTQRVYLNNPTLTRTEFLEFLAREFELAPAAAASKTGLLQRARARSAASVTQRAVIAPR